MKTILFNTHDLALIITLYQCILFALFLISMRKGKKQSNLLLAAFLLSQAAIPLDNLINFGEGFKNVAVAISPKLLYTFGLAFWLEAPLLLLYIKSLIYKDYQLKKSNLLYFLPFALYFIYFLNSWLLADISAEAQALQDNAIAKADTVERLIHVFRELFRLSCGVLCFYELQKYQKQIKNEVADIESVDLSWLKILVIGFLGIKVAAVTVALALVSSYEWHYYIDHELLGLTANYITLFLVSALIFFSAGHSTLFKGINRDLVVEDKNKEPVDPQLIAQITGYMQEQKPYLNHLLTLDNLAKQLNLSARNLSQIINRHFDKNFFEFINHYRIEESKALLQNPAHKKTTMLDIMDQAGFNSKATFNTFFKKLTGVTPSQFRNDYLANQAASK
ncbi:helix-turn-helix domain-containing protein [Algibacillus agarilyticus]|uniref:helix-turn-helix domain-containing protein n=1 Tax=Algibacillus agarilyticus TaxID=2234133 RepID=UPI000DD041B0|nr:AraC family transcriptional regulator [Algibacillus agarilyticus]